MKTYKIKKIKLPGIQQYLYEIYSKNCFKNYKPLNNGYYKNPTDAFNYLVNNIKNFKIIFKNED